jgi:hypothetical protein
MAKTYVKLNLGVSKKAITQGIDNLQTALKANPHFSLKTRLKFKSAISHLTKARRRLNKVRCDPPDMSIECPPPPPSAQARTRARRRTR